MHLVKKMAKDFAWRGGRVPGQLLQKFSEAHAWGLVDDSAEQGRREGYSPALPIMRRVIVGMSAA